mgnify:CR=1 FL=1
MQLHQLFPQLTIWLDAGIRTLNDWQDWCDIPNIKPVLGSETLQDLQLLNTLQPTEFILSLDFRQGHLLGQYDLLTQVDLWPDTIIVMSLDTVGMDNGPDEKLLNTIQKSFDCQCFTQRQTWRRYNTPDNELKMPPRRAAFTSV